MLAFVITSHLKVYRCLVLETVALPKIVCSCVREYFHSQSGWMIEGYVVFTKLHILYDRSVEYLPPRHKVQNMMR